MICPVCGTESSANAQFCGECGASFVPSAAEPIPSDPQQIESETSAGVPPAQRNSPSDEADSQDWKSGQPGSGWLKFVVYFLLPACAFMQVAFGILYVTGSLWATELGSASAAYQYFPNLQTASLIVGALYLLAAVVTLIAEITLTQFRSFAPVVLLVACGCTALVAVADIAIISAAVGAPYARYVAIALIVVGLGSFVANLFYFRTRKHWFAAGSPAYTLLGASIWRRIFGTIVVLLGGFALLGSLSHVGDTASFSLSTFGMALAMITGGIVMLVKK